MVGGMKRPFAAFFLITPWLIVSAWGQFRHLTGNEMPQLQQASENDLADRLIIQRLEILLSSGPRQPIDCGSRTMRKPDEERSRCARAEFGDRNSFHLLNSGPVGYFHYSFGLAGDAEGNVYEVQYDVRYDSRRLRNLNLGRKAGKKGAGFRWQSDQSHDMHQAHTS